MKALFARAGVDYAQWVALVRAALKVDYRTSSLARAPAHREVKAASAVVGQIIFYTLMGGAISALVWLGRDLFLASVIVIAYVMFMVGTASLLDHNAAVTSPDDYLILGPRPISSRTYFAARVANVLVYTLAMTTAFAYLPLIAFFFRHGAVIGTASVVAVYASSLATALTMIVSYTTLMRLVGPQRLRRLLSYVQLAASFLVYGGYFLVADLVGKQVLAVAFAKQPWMAALPPVWFASYIELAAGRTSALELAPAALSIVVIVALAASLGGRLSMDYASRLGAVLSASTGRAAAFSRPPRRAVLFTRDEARAVALLIRGQFRNDTKFRMGVLAILPLTILYMLMGMRDGGLVDPFVQQRRQGSGMLTMAIMMFPSMLRMNLVRSDAFRASWIFFATPADRVRLIRASKNLLVVSFLGPYLIGVGAVLAYVTHSAAHVAVHLVMLALVSHLVLQVVILFEPELPFSKPLVKGSSTSRVFVVMFVVGVSAVLLPIFAPIIYRQAWLTVATMLGIVLASIAIDRLTRLRVEAIASRLEFEG